MLADLKPYPKMRDSGVEWLGAVPAHWGVRRLAQFGTLSKGSGGNKDDERSAGVPCIRYGDLYTTHHNFIQRSRSFISNERVAEYSTTRFGDVLFASSGETIDEIGKSAANVMQADACCGGDVIIFRPTESVDARYLGYVMDCPPVAAQKARMGRGITVMHIYAAQLKYLVIPLPPLVEQTAIARFLDHVDRRIRHHIHAKQKLIALLEEQKHATIHQAVTGKVDVRTGEPYSAYKRSGVLYVGCIPKHWRTARLKVVLARSIQNGLFKKKDQYGNGSPLINVSDVYGQRFFVEPSSLERVQASADETMNYRVLNGDILLVRSSLKLEGTGRAAIAMNCSDNTVFECHLVRARPDDRRIHSRYLALLLNSWALRHYFVSRAKVVTMATIAQDTISSCRIVLPPVSEQDGIVEWLDSRCNKLISAIEQANRDISLLREYQERLIADVVRGKHDVHELAYLADKVAS
ncbi:MAG: restriction endonuclease subunit S [Spirochaetaceae bacterium]|nr:restriction endonuclease subunit S [Spirochaetaceae bacterium]